MNRLTMAAVLAAVAVGTTGCMNATGASGQGMYGPGMYGAGTMMGAGMGPGGAGMMMGGPGMMMGGPGAMWGLERLDLSADQRTRIARIQDETHAQMQAFQQAMHAQDGPMAGVMGSTALDDAAARQAYATMSAVHKQMFDLHLQARRRILEVLTPAQREQLGRAWGPGR